MNRLFVPVGIEREPSEVYPVRTVWQRNVVAEIIARAEFDFACYNPFDRQTKEHFAKYGPEGGDITFAWNDMQGNLRITRIAEDGSIVREHTIEGK